MSRIVRRSRLPLGIVQVVKAGTRAAFAPCRHSTDFSCPARSRRGAALIVTFCAHWLDKFNPCRPVQTASRRMLYGGVQVSGTINRQPTLRLTGTVGVTSLFRI